MEKTRSYSCSDVDMLMAARTIAETFRSNISVLSTVRTDWTEQYADDYIARIISAMGKTSESIREKISVWQAWP